MSTAIPLLVVIALVVAVALGGVGIWAAIEMAKAARAARRLAEDVDSRVVPLADKLDVSVDAFNAELLRVDMIVDQLEGAVDRLAGTADNVREVVDAPIHLVTEVAERVRRGLRRRPRSRSHEAAQQEPAETAESQVILLETGAEVSGDESLAAEADYDRPAGASDEPSVIDDAGGQAPEPLADDATVAPQATEAAEPVSESSPDELELLDPTTASVTTTDDPEEA